jgi:hypothetical protein
MDREDILTKYDSQLQALSKSLLALNDESNAKIN